MTYRRCVRCFGGAVTGCRVALGLTQKQLGHKAHLKEVTIQSLEKGRRAPSFGTILRLARALNVMPDALMDDISL